MAIRFLSDQAGFQPLLFLLLSNVSMNLCDFHLIAHHFCSPNHVILLPVLDLCDVCFSHLQTLMVLQIIEVRWRTVDGGSDSLSSCREYF